MKTVRDTILGFLAATILGSLVWWSVTAFREPEPQAVSKPSECRECEMQRLRYGPEWACSKHD